MSVTPARELLERAIGVAILLAIVSYLAGAALWAALRGSRK